MSAVFSGNRWISSLRALVALACWAAPLSLGSCSYAAMGGSGQARSASMHRAPSVRLVRFDGIRGVFRVRNRSSRLLQRVAIGLRGFGCEGPRPIRTEVKVFDLRLRPGQGQLFAFQQQHRCRRVALVVIAQ